MHRKPMSSRWFVTAQELVSKYGQSSLNIISNKKRKKISSLRKEIIALESYFSTPPTIHCNWFLLVCLSLLWLHCTSASTITCRVCNNYRNEISALKVVHLQIEWVSEWVSNASPHRMLVCKQHSEVQEWLIRSIIPSPRDEMESYLPTYQQ